jgi:hypothetical protein
VRSSVLIGALRGREKFPRRIGLGSQLPLNIAGKEIKRVYLYRTRTAVNLRDSAGLKSRLADSWIASPGILFLNLPNRSKAGPKGRWKAARRTWCAGTAIVGYQHWLYSLIRP